MIFKRCTHWLVLFCLLTSLFGQIQGQAVQNSANRSVQNNYSAPRASSTLSFRIENGKCWVNGNLMDEKDLPVGLRSIDPSVYYQTAVLGINEIGFQLYGKAYLIRIDKIIELPPVSTQQNTNVSRAYPQQEAAEEYYGQLKRESPTLFHNIGREGMLYEQCRDLLLRHQKAKGKDQDALREEMRNVLGQLFDINERNRQMEIQELELMIESAKKEVMFRKANKGSIIDNALDELLEQ